jgi:hypothetical protein
MEKINPFRVIIAGLIASLSFIIIETIFEGLIKILFQFDEVNLLLQYFPNVTLSGTRYYIINFAYLILTCEVTLWLYAALIPKFREGFKTALLAGLIVIILITLFMVNYVNMNIIPLKPVLISLALSLVEFPLSIVIGAGFYKSK